MPFKRSFEESSVFFLHFRFDIDEETGLFKCGGALEQVCEGDRQSPLVRLKRLLYHF